LGVGVVAVVVPRTGAALDSEAMLADLKQQLANFKVPKRIHFTDQLVRNTMGKVQKNVLREKYKTL
jgi:malonyl-CoA/methylmalonyl-CoA synthetase